MPSGSGSHGGGGGGHSHGGGGGHYSHGGGSSYRSSRPRGMMHGRHVYFYSYHGSRYYRTTTASGVVTAFIYILIAIAVLTFLTFSTLSSAKSQLEDITYDYQKYNDMIIRAEDEPDFLLVGNEETETGGYVYSLGKKYDKYCLKYYFFDRNHRQVYGYSFYVYTAEEASSYYHKWIDLASDTRSDRLHQATDTIELTYKTKTLNDDSEYVAINNTTLPRTRTYLIIEGCAIGVVVVIAILVGATTLHKDTNEKSTQATIDGAPKTAKTANRKCPYCGSTIKDGETKCRSCGGSVY